MTTCQYCRAPLSSAATRFCTRCGTPVAAAPAAPDPNQEPMTFAGLAADAPSTDTLPALAAFGFGPPPDGPEAPEPEQPSTRRRWALITVGVLLVLGAVLLVLLTRGTSGHAPTSRPTAPASGTTPTTPSPSPSPSPSDPAGVVTAYYNDINQHDYQAAWQLGGDHLGESYSSFVSGFSNTTQDTVTVTSVSGDTAAVTLAAQNSDGSVADYSGDYTVQNGVITSASLEPTN